MTYRLRISRSAEKDIRSLAKPMRLRIHQRILDLAVEPRRRGARKLRGADAWRVRVGDYRIVFQIDDRCEEVTVFLVKHRKDVYR